MLASEASFDGEMRAAEHKVGYEQLGEVGGGLFRIDRVVDDELERLGQGQEG